MSSGVKAGKQPGPSFGMILIGMAVLLRMLVPVGWMPHVGNGEVRMVLCDGFGSPAAEAPTMAHAAQMPGHHQATNVESSPDRSAPAHDERQTGMASCPFTATSAPALIVAALAGFAPLLPLDVNARWIAFAVTRATRLAAPPPPAIGPPIA